MPRKYARVLALVPAHNEGEKLEMVLENLGRHVDKIIVCDDGSDDDTGKVARGMGVRVITHSRNIGYGSALRSLFMEAKNEFFDVAVTIDADGQHRPEYIPYLVNRMYEMDLDIVIGSRLLSVSGSVPTVRRWGIKLLNLILSIALGLSLTDSQSGFRAYNRNAVEVISPEETGMGVSTEIIIKAARRGLAIGEAPITVSYYQKRSPLALLRQGLDVYMNTFKHLLS